MSERLGALVDRLRPVVRRHGAALLVILIVTTVVLGASAMRFPRLSKFDESTHIDMVIRASRLEVIRKGDRFLDETRYRALCRGSSNRPDDPPACPDLPLPPADGRNYNAFHPPVYYLVTGLSARAIVALTPVDDIVNAARLMGIVWVGAGLVMLYATLMLFGLRRRVAVAACVIVPLIPAVTHMSSIVNNDATSVFAGSLVLLSVVLVDRGRLPVWSLFPVAFVVASLKVMHAAAVIFAVMFLLVRWLQQRSTPGAGKRLALGTFFMVAGVGVVQIGWRVIQSIRVADPDYVPHLRGTESELKVELILRRVNALIPPTRETFIPPEIFNQPMRLWYPLTSMLLASVIFAVAFMAKPKSRDRAIGAASVLGLAAAGLVVASYYYFQSQRYPDMIHPRYGLSVVPAMMLCAAIATGRERMGQRMLIGYAAFGLVTVVPSFTGLW
jgi:hypothetical protein